MLFRPKQIIRLTWRLFWSCFIPLPFYSVRNLYASNI